MDLHGPRGALSGHRHDCTQLFQPRMSEKFTNGRVRPDGFPDPGPVVVVSPFASEIQMCGGSQFASSVTFPFSITCAPNDLGMFVALFIFKGNW